MLHTSSVTSGHKPELDSEALVQSLQAATQRWHQQHEELHKDASSLADLVLLLHRANFDLWHEEDKARAPQASDAEIAATKRAIDRLNQQRVNMAEKIDLHLLGLAGEQNANAPLNSETPGSILDRLSITTLKLFHTQEEIDRADAEESHRERNRERFAVLDEQRADLTECLGQLWNEIMQGTRRFKVNQPMKMYNDPSLNPAIYRAQAQKQDRL